MTFAQSRKTFSCWNCQYFVHENPSESYAGWCRRHAPKALDLYGPGPNILTTKGDILTHDPEKLVRLPVGENGQVLTASSAFIEGIYWNWPRLYYAHENVDDVITIADVFPQPAYIWTLPADFPGGDTLIIASYAWSKDGETDKFWGNVIADQDPLTKAIAVVEDGVPDSATEFKSAAGQLVVNLPAGEQGIRLQIGRQAGGTTDNCLAKFLRLTVVVIVRSYTP